MNYFPLLILSCLKKINGERTISSIYHLFNGKRSAQTIQDAKLYHLTSLFGVFPSIERNEIEESTNDLIHHEAIKIHTDNRYIVTKKGDQLLQSFSLPSSLNGWKYSNSTTMFWERVSFIIQVLSNIVRNQSRFIPISRDRELQRWVKSLLKELPMTRFELSEKLYEELIRALDQVENVQASIFVAKLTSHTRIGSTNEQISDIFKLSPYQVTVLFKATIHHLLNEVEQKTDNYPILSKVANLNGKTLVLTQSTERTYDLIKEGKGIEEIAAIRFLKRNTIEDHIVEIALADDTFDISTYVDDKRYKMIEKCIRSLKTN